uniref:Uncharacterized protein n=1 Tax=Quercus lobata TaxID=97700 RepID=A0A7N2LWY2_QUELO
MYLHAGLCESYCAPLTGTKDSVLMEIKSTALAPDISPSGDTQPFIPLLAPSPLTPFTNNTVPILSGAGSLGGSNTLMPTNCSESNWWNTTTGQHGIQQQRHFLLVVSMGGKGLE